TWPRCASRRRRARCRRWLEHLASRRSHRRGRREPRRSPGRPCRRALRVRLRRLGLRGAEARACRPKTLPPSTRPVPALTRTGGRESVTHAYERRLAPFLLAAGDHVKHLETGFDLLGCDPARTDMLRRAHDAGITGVEIHLEGIGDFPADHGALEEMHMIQRV